MRTHSNKYNNDWYKLYAFSVQSAGSCSVSRTQTVPINNRLLDRTREYVQFWRGRWNVKQLFPHNMWLCDCGRCISCTRNPIASRIIREHLSVQEFDWTHSARRGRSGFTSEFLTHIRRHQIGLLNPSSSETRRAMSSEVPIIIYE